MDETGLHPVLPFGPIGPDTVHVCVDMQRLFAEPTGWYTPWMARILPNVVAMTERHAAATIFTAFIPPAQAEEMPGAWQRVYRHWPGFTLERLDPDLLDLLPPLAALVPPATLFEKRTYSPFTSPRFRAALSARGVRALVVTGGETDVCVLATVLGAIEFGYRVVLVEDALCSSADRTHDLLIELYRSRFRHQIEIADCATVLAAWS